VAEVVRQNLLRLDDLDSVEAGPFDGDQHLDASLKVVRTEGEHIDVNVRHKKGVLKKNGLAVEMPRASATWGIVSPAK
jgi:hypothetical protein